MNKLQKREMIKNYKNVAIASLDKVLDSLYSMKNQYSPELVRAAGFNVTEKEEKILSDYNKSIPIYEAIKRTVQNDEELTTYEINLIGISMLFAGTLMKSQGENMIKSSTKIVEMANKLMT